MTSQAITPSNGTVATLPEWERKLDLVRRTVADGATPDEFELFCHQARRAGLDPLSKQIYCIVRGKGENRKATIQTGIDGYRLIADRTGLYAGNDDAVFAGQGDTLTATVTVWKLVNGQRCPFSATARWAEYKPEYGDQMWRKMPHTMLAKVAEALALRKAFPADLSGIYTGEEMDQADEPERPAPRQQQPRPMPQRQAILGRARVMPSGPDSGGITDAQMETIRRVAADLQLPGTAIDQIAEEDYQLKTRKLSEGQANGLIATLQKMAAEAATDEPAETDEAE